MGKIQLPKTCLIYNEDFLNSTWAKGQTALNEIQQFFVYKIKEKNQKRRSLLPERLWDPSNRYNFLKPGSKAKHTVKIRMVDTQKAHWRAWKQPIEISSKEPESILVYVYMLVILGTLVYGYSGHRLFLPVPQAKDKLNNNDEIDHKILWEGFTHEMGNGEKEEVLTVEEAAE
ncbi:hypothetical protein Celaphus_00012023, partial [Cervus elaphus hippelaphus]